MRKPSHNMGKTSRRLGATGAVVTERPGSSTSRRVRATRKKGAALFKAFVSKETPTAKKIDLIRAGVGARIVDDMVEYLDVPKNVIFGVLHTPESTAHKLIKDNRTLDSAASERVVRVADITRMAEATFGRREAAAQWLKSPNLALRGATPLSMLDTEPGAAEVRRILSAIDYGGAF
jgi:putative toxin-antitoxin system antitoxin component (TIGR02293 family)